MTQNVLLIQLPVPQLVPQELTGNTPVATAGLLLYCRRTGVDARITLLDQLSQSRLGDTALVNEIVSQSPDVIGFTCTVWNIERVLFLARILKNRLKGVRIWLGGPEIAPDSYIFEETDPPFDLAVEGEGEHLFASLLGGADPRSLPRVHIPGVAVNTAARVPLIESLDLVSDPFADGIVHPESDGVMLAEFMRGCRYRCSFCQYHHGRSGAVPAGRSLDEITRTFAHARNAGIQELFLLDPSLEQRPDFRDFLEHLAKVNRDPVVPLFVELRAEFIDEPVATALFEAGVRSVETGIQTVNEDALRRTGRHFSRERFTRGIRSLQSAGITVKADIMAGLPGDTPQGMSDTIDYITDLGLAEHVQFFRTQVLPGTALRRSAVELDIKYEPRPPYFMLSTPSWPLRSLEDAIHSAEERLGVSFTAEDRPVLAVINSTGSGIDTHTFPGTTALYFAGWDLTVGTAILNLACEPFDRMCNAFTLQFKTDTIMTHLRLIADAVRRCMTQNPFSSLCTAIDLPPGSPLDVFDEIDAIFDEQTVSHYADRMFSTASTSRPQRRQLALLDLNLRTKIDAGWLHDLRDLCQIVWRTGPVSADVARRRAIDFDPGEDDYLFIDPDEGLSVSGLTSLCRDLAQTAALPQQILLPALDLHWRFLKIMENDAAHARS